MSIGIKIIYNSKSTFLLFLLLMQGLVRYFAVSSMKIDFKQIFYEDYLKKRGYNKRYRENDTGEPKPKKMRMSSIYESVHESISSGFSAMQSVFRTRIEQQRAKSIQKWWKFWKRFIPNNNTDDSGSGKHGNIRINGKDAMCVITQDSIPTNDSFKIVDAFSGNVMAYTLSQMVEYLRSTGKFECPCTRSPILKPDVVRMMAKARQCGVESHDLIEVYNRRHLIAGMNSERQNRMLAIEVSCSTSLEECIDICSEMNLSTTIVQQQLLFTLLPNWRQYVESFRYLEARACYEMLRRDQRKVALLRRRNSALVDPHGLLGLVYESISMELLNTEYRPTTAFRTVDPRILDINLGGGQRRRRGGIWRSSIGI